MVYQTVHLSQKNYSMPPIVHMVQNDTGRILDAYMDDFVAMHGSMSATLHFMRPDGSYYSVDDLYPEFPVNGFYFDMTQALTRPGRVVCQVKVNTLGEQGAPATDVSTYTFYVDVQEAVDGLPVEQLGYDIYDLMDAASQISGTVLTDDIKQALLDCFEHVAWTDEHGQDYVDALEAALYPPAELASISAVYTQSGTVYTTDTLDSLKTNLVVTAHYTDSTTETVTTYTLSGTLTEGTSAITVSYGGKTTTFNVTVTAPATLSSITAVYTQSGTVYDTDSLDSLKSDLVVTATYSDSSTATVASTDYTLSGTLTAGTSTITVSYGGKTTSFNVTVTGDVDYNQESLWEIGGLNANGTIVANTSRLRTIDYIPSAVKKISVDSGYSYILVCYNSNGTVKNGTQGYYNPNTNAMTNIGVYYTGEIILDDIASVIGEYNNIKVLMRNESNPSATITTTEGLKIHLKG